MKAKAEKNAITYNTYAVGNYGKMYSVTYFV